jgi:hypothetical protein
MDEGARATVTVSRREVLAATGLAAAAVALHAYGGGREALAEKKISVTPSKPHRIPGKRNCYSIDFEICNTGDEPLRFNGVKLQWPEGVDPDPAPQPQHDPLLGWQGVGSTTENGLRTVKWLASAPVVLAKDPDGKGDGDCTLVRLEFCCMKPRKVKFRKGGRLILRMGSKDVVAADTDVPICK